MGGQARSCDFCGGALDLVYQVPESDRGMLVAVCQRCGLVQSLQTRAKPAGRPVKASSGADWGNIRHGKGLRFDKTVSLIEQSIPWADVKSVVDLGANRGDFVLWCRRTHPGARVMAVEPDQLVIERYRDAPGIELVPKRMEDAGLEGPFDVVHCSHTLEHADSARQAILLMNRLLAVGGYLFLEVPNIEFIGAPENVEEFFIDKHTFHFSRPVLMAFLKSQGFEIVQGEDSADPANITLIARKCGEAGAAFTWDGAAVAESHCALIRKYQTTLEANREKLKSIADRLHEFTGRQAVVLWGGGRILDALVRYGGLDLSRVRYVIDKYLQPYLSEVHGAKLYGPRQLRFQTPDVVIILARSAVAEIEREVRQYGIRHVIRFQDLFNL